MVQAEAPQSRRTGVTLEDRILVKIEKSSEVVNLDFKCCMLKALSPVILVITLEGFGDPEQELYSGAEEPTAGSAALAHRSSLRSRCNWWRALHVCALGLRQLWEGDFLEFLDFGEST